MISVIVPVYNGEKYISNTIKKILEQPYSDIELILVNDGSKDDSNKICEYFRKLDSRVVLINKANAGISAARNTGIESAKGEYVSFIDQDDVIKSNIYTVLSEVIGNTDMCIAGKIMHLIDKNNNEKNCIEYRYAKKCIQNIDQIFDLAINANRDTCALHLWNCLYKRSIIIDNNIRFNHELRCGHEDSLFNAQYLAKCGKVSIVGDVVYEYFRRANQSTSLKSNSAYLNDFEVFYMEFIAAWSDLNCINEKDAKIYTFMLRLGINFYSQYGVYENEIAAIFDVCNRELDERRITKSAINSFPYYIYLYIINKLLINKSYNSAAKMVRFLKNR